MQLRKRSSPKRNDYITCYLLNALPESHQLWRTTKEHEVRTKQVLCVPKPWHNSARNCLYLNANEYPGLPKSQSTPPVISLLWLCSFHPSGLSNNDLQLRFLAHQSHAKASGLWHPQVCCFICLTMLLWAHEKLVSECSWGSLFSAYQTHSCSFDHITFPSHSPWGDCLEQYTHTHTERVVRACVQVGIRKYKHTYTVPFVRRFAFRNLQFHTEMEGNFRFF